jgi:hypothetical protein
MIQHELRPRGLHGLDEMQEALAFNVDVDVPAKVGDAA